MIFFGSKGKVIPGEPVQGVQCPSCENGQFVSFGILKYFHLYWIPTFLTSRKVGVECMHCKRTLVGDEVPSHLAEQIKSNVFTAGKTLPMFSGLFIIAMGILAVSFAVQQETARENEYLAQPAIADQYVVDFSKIFSNVDPGHHYGVMRITSVTPNEVEMQISNIVYDKASGVRRDIRDGKTAADSYYDPETVSFAIGQLQEYKDAGAVYSIERP